MKNKEKQVIVSHNVLPPTFLVITEWGYHLKFGSYSIPFSKEDARRLINELEKSIHRR